MRENEPRRGRQKWGKLLVMEKYITLKQRGKPASNNVILIGDQPVLLLQFWGAEGVNWRSDDLVLQWIPSAVRECAILLFVIKGINVFIVLLLG